MKVYLVMKKGVYMQAVVGIYDTYERAMDAVTKAKEMETDGYHSFLIYGQELNSCILYSCEEGIISIKGIR